MRNLASFLLCLASITSGQAQASFEEELSKALTAAQLEQLLERFPDEATRIVPKIEQAAIAEIRSGGAGSRYVLKTPVGGPSASNTMKQHASGDFEFTTEFPDDRIIIGSAGFPDPPVGDGSVQRYDGRLELVPGLMIIIGEGDKAHRLTFAVVQGLGYVHIRGKGQVLLGPEGKRRETKLGDSRQQ